MKLLRKILWPLNLPYFLVIWCRNYCYDLGFLNSKSYEFPVICVGNLSVGGTGKTPMVEFLVQFLQSKFRVAVLSRGYGRQSRGFQLADATSTAKIIGDEPFQMAQKFPNINVAVDANRQRGIEMLQNLNIPPEVILLDDAFQHRSVIPNYSILLTSYDDLYCDDFVLPSGNLREPRSGAKRAHVIVVTKCPEDLNFTEKQQIKVRLNINPNQHLFFSSISYSNVVISKTKQRPLKDFISQKICLVTGIANPKPMLNHLNRMGLEFEHLKFPDHHNFSDKELKIIASKAIVLTTEKDFSRLQVIRKDQLYYLPISTKIDFSNIFENLLFEAVKKNTTEDV